MKKTTLFTMLTMLLLFVSSNVWADDEPFYTLETVPFTEGTNHTDYNKYFDDEHDGMIWNAPGNQSMDGRWRIGGKSTKEVPFDKVDRTITAKTPMASAIDRVVLNHFGVSRDQVTVNSLTLTVASDEEYKTVIDEVVLTPSITKGKAGSEEFLPTAFAEWPTEAYYRLTINLSNTSTSNGGLDVASIQFFAPTGGGGVTVRKPSITPNGGTFYEPQEVTLVSEGNTIYYTLDGTEPNEASTEYTVPFVVSQSCTVKAIAYDNDDNASSIASADFIIKTAATYTSIAELCAAATKTQEQAVVVFNNWICTGVANSNAYFTDGKNGILLYQNGHGFEVGDVLTGSTQVSLTLYNECAEIVGLTSTSQGLTVTKGEGAIPMKVVISDLEKNMQGNLITLENVTYNAASNVFIDDDDNEITPYNRFIKLPTLIDGKPYNVTGVAIWFANKQVWEIAPRTEQEFQLLTSQIAPVSSWSVASESVHVNGTPTATFTTNSDGAVTYTSSDENVATIDANGNITPKAYGVTTITASVAETETYLADSKSFTLRVNEEGYAEVVFAYNDEDIAGLGAPDTGAEITVTRNDVITFYANKAYAKPDDTHIKFYGSKFEKQGEGEEETTVLTEPSIIQLSVVNGYAIVKITLTATGEGYIKEWKDQYGTAAAIDGATATWEGDCEKVVLTNQASSQARIKTIAVTYIDTSIVDAISLTPATSEGEKVIYNLAGQRLQKMQKGINIVGGKKYIVK